MFLKILKWLGIALAVVVVFAAGGFFYVKSNVESRLSKVYTFEPEIFLIPDDSASIAEGKYLSVIKGCQDCHGKNFEGGVVIDDGGVGRLVGTNITQGKGGLPADFSEADYIRAFRHGINREGKSLRFMPSYETTRLSERDMGMLIAYLSQVPPVDNVLPPTELGPLAYVLTYAGKMPLIPVEMIDHTRPMVALADTNGGVRQGEYLAVQCSGCHRPDFKGGDPVAPGFPPVPNITTSGQLKDWTMEEFVHTLRTGKTPDGRQLKNENMPWQMTAQYRQKELEALYQYFKSI